MSDYGETIILPSRCEKRIANAKSHLKQRQARVDRLITKIESFLDQTGHPVVASPKFNPDQFRHLRLAILKLIQTSIELHDAENVK